MGARLLGVEKVVGSNPITSIYKNIIDTHLTTHSRGLPKPLFIENVMNIGLTGRSRELPKPPFIKKCKMRF